MRTFFELFARSPFEPLMRHAEKVREVVDRLPPLIEAFLTEDWERTRELHAEISRLEHKADQIKQEIRDHLPKSLFMAVDRGDILDFLKEQDAIADSAEDVAVLVSLRETPAHEAMREGVRDLVQHVMRTVDGWHGVVQELPGLQESSFTGPEVKKVLQMVQDTNTLEWEADKVQAELSRTMVRYEEELGAISFFFWMRIASKLGEVANHCENTAERLRLMLARA